MLVHKKKPFDFSHQAGRRQSLKAGVLAAAAMALPGVLRAQPADMTRLVAGFPPGGPADTIARLVASLMSDAPGKVMVENRPGASGQLAADAVRKAGAQGNTLLVTPSSILTLVPHLYRAPMYQSLDDFATVAGICDHSFGLAVNGNSPITTVEEFIAEAKAKPETASYATAGAGTGMHLLGTLFARETGAPLLHIPYKGTAPGLQDLMGGQVLSTFNPLPTMLELHRAGRIRIIAVSNPQRVASLPDVPTFTELGLPSLELVEWFGVFAAADTDPKVLAATRLSLAQALNKPELAVAARKLELEPRPESAEALREMLEHDYRRMSELVKLTGLSLDN